MTEYVEIVEMGPRDGLQNERRLIPAAGKIALVDLLGRAGFRRIEVTSFVPAAWVPQMADAAEVMAGITRAPGVRYGVLTPNLRGYHAARAARADEVAVFASASEGFSRANLNCSVEDSVARFVPVLLQATLGLGVVTALLLLADRIGWWWKRARTLAGVNNAWRLHDLRHWSATVAIGQGHDVRTVAGRLVVPVAPGPVRTVAAGFVVLALAVAGAISAREPTLDDVYLRLTGDSLAAAA